MPTRARIDDFFDGLDGKPTMPPCSDPQPNTIGMNVPEKKVHNAKRTIVVLENICTPEIRIINLIWTIFTRPIEMVAWSLEIDTCVGIIPVWAKWCCVITTGYCCCWNCDRAEEKGEDTPIILPVWGSISIVGLIPPSCPSLVTSKRIRGVVESAGKVYRCRAVRRVDVSSTRIALDRFVEKYPGEA